MGILGNMLKQAIVVGASAIPGIGMIAGPVAAAALGGPGASAKLTSAIGAIAGGAGGGDAAPSPEAAAIQPDAIAGRVADSVEDSFQPSMVRDSPLGMMAAQQVIDQGAAGASSFGGAVSAAGLQPPLKQGLFAGAFNNGGGF